MKYLLVVALLVPAICFNSPQCTTNTFGGRKEEICDYRCRYEYVENPSEDINCENINQIHITNTSNICQNYACSIRFTENNVQIIRSNTFVRLQKLEKIYLNNSNIHVIQSGAFSGVVQVTAIHLDRNNLSSISKGSFRFLPNLNYLNLSRNTINKLSDEVFEEPNSVEYLDLSYNNITELTFKTIGSTYKLKMLNLSHNNLKKMDQNWCHHLHFLKYLYIENNEINTVVDCSLNSNIEELSLNGNLLANLSDSFFPISSREIHLSNNYISSLNGLAFNKLVNLIELDLSHNDLNHIPFGVFKDLGNVDVLDISHNKIEKMDYGIFIGLYNLTFLNMSNNRLIHLEDRLFNHLLRLAHLDISENHINYFIIDHKSFLNPRRKLRSLEIDGNNFSCSDLATIMFSAKIYNTTVPYGTISKTDNINGIACSSTTASKSMKKSVISSMNESNYVSTYFEQDFRNSSFFKFFQNTYENSKYSNATQTLNNMFQIQRELANNISSDINKIITWETSFFHKFLSDLSNNLEKYSTRNNESNFKQIQNGKSVQSENSFQQFLEEFSLILNQSRTEFNNLREKDVTSKSHDQITAALQSDDNRLDNVIISLNQLKFCIILCTLIVLFFCALKGIRYLKVHFSAVADVARSRGIPLFDQDNNSQNVD